jgi:short-subunit dehydrogenase
MVVVITGASAGIGKALAAELAARGAKLVLAARRLEVLEQLNQSLGGGHLCVRADVSKREDCDALIARAVEHFGRIDTLVCNAGYGIYRRVDETSPDQTRQIFATNFFGTTDCIAAALPVMKRQGPRDDGKWRGQIMIVSSAAGRRGVPFLGVYSATKAAQLTLTDALRVELRRDRIAVTGVYPIQTQTDFGQTAESLGGTRLPRLPKTGFGQSAEHVARRMMRAIQHPVPEVWPARPAKWFLALGNLMPRLTDAVMRRFARKVEQANKAGR